MTCVLVIQHNDKITDKQHSFHILKALECDDNDDTKRVGGGVVLGCLSLCYIAMSFITIVTTTICSTAAR